MLCFPRPVVAQALPAPERDQLLNGLQVLYWPTPGTAKVLLKLRIHSGAAFDLAGKAGQMSVLGDLLFPDPATIEYFKEEMGGRLEVAVNYDSTTITMEGKASELENIIEALRNALLSTQFTPDVVTRVRDAHIKILRDTSISPSTVADRAIAARLFGDFPYGRPANGSAEDVERLDRADLMLAHERFFNSNNATLAVLGDVNRPRLMRTLRQILGPWRKSERIVPNTFRQPKPADPRTLLIEVPAQTSELRIAVRGLSRADSDLPTGNLVAKLLYSRWVALFPPLARKPAFVRNEAHVLPGMFVVGTAVEETAVADAMTAARKAIDSLLAGPVSAAELERAKNELISENTAGAKSDSALTSWLDRDTYKLKDETEPTMGIHNVTPGDIQRVATRLFKDVPLASVITGDPVHLKAVLEGRFTYEVFGLAPASSPQPKAPGKPAKPSPS